MMNWTGCRGEAVVAYFKVLSPHLLEVLRKTTKNWQNS